MKRKATLFASVCSSLLALGVTPVNAEFMRPRVMLASQIMFGVGGPFLGSERAIRGVPGDDLPWEIEGVNAVLWSNGRVRVAVKGLVFADDEMVPPELRGTNGAAKFRAIVSCSRQTEDGATEIVNVWTRAFAASRQGDSFINDKIDLPEACVAPIVFLAPGDEDDWVAVTGVDR